MAMLGGSAQPVYIANDATPLGGSAQPVVLVDTNGNPLGTLTSNAAAMLAIEGAYNVKAYGAAGDGVANDSAAFAAALAAINSTNGGILYIPAGTYRLASTINVSGKSNLTIAGAGRGTQLLPDAGVTAITVATADRFRLSNLRITGGAGGLSVDNCYDGQFNAIQIDSATGDGINIAGDSGGMEQHYTDIIIRACGGIGLNYHRTNLTDTGGLYLTDVRIIRDGSGTGGLAITSTNASKTGVFVSGVNVAIDGYTNTALTLTQVHDVRFASLWVGGGVAAKGIAQISDCYKVQITNAIVVQSNGTGYGIEIINNVAESIFTNIVFDGGVDAFHLTTFSGAKLHIADIQSYATNYTNNLSSLAQGMATQQIFLPLTIMTNSGGAATEALILDDTANPTQHKYIRNVNGHLRVINTAFSSDIFSLEDTGKLTITDQFRATGAGANSGIIAKAGPTATIAFETKNTSDTTVFSIDKAGHLTTGGATAPSIAAGTGAGTSPTVSLTNASDTAGLINVTTGSGTPATDATIATITFGTAHAASPRAVILTPANKATQSLALTTQPFVDSASPGTSSFIVKSNGVGLATATAYKWWYVVIW